MGYNGSGTGKTIRRYDMKKGLILIVLFALAFSLVAAAGCGNKETTTVSTPSGDITVTTDDTGSVTGSDKAPSEADMGAPVYPGAKYVTGTGAIRVKMSSTEGDTFITGASFTTTDSLSKVVDYYTGKMGTPVESTPETASWIQVSSDAMVTVSATVENGKVTIAIGKIASK
jgi:hypothetical protein